MCQASANTAAKGWPLPALRWTAVQGQSVLPWWAAATRASRRAIDLAGIVSQVTLIEFDSTLRADAVLQEKLPACPVSVITRAQSREISGEAGRVNGLLYTDRATGQERQIALEGCLCRSACCPTPTGSSSCRAVARSSSMPADRPTSRVCSVPATAPAA